MKKLYVVGDNNKAAVNLSELSGFGGCVYAHGILEDMAGYDMVGQLADDKYEQKDFVENVIAVLPDGKEIPATVFIWIGKEDRFYKWRTGEVTKLTPKTRLLGLLVAKSDTRSLQYAQEKFVEKPMFI